ncbi:MAG TPA: hypothetical protein VD790_05115 [Thermoleophilaceae bacterium]|nr:hypothetical protein [Thermoleophilaceae bacterium]
MADSLVIPARFNGPPDSGHGGYSAGLVGTLVDGPAEAALRAPPPLETPLAVERDGERVSALEGRTVVLDAAPAEVDVEPPAPVGVDEAVAAEADSFFRSDLHPFPTCFACGPRRPEGDGLRLFAGPIPGRDLFAAAWTPAAEFAGADGAVDPLFVWTALDCPSSAPAMTGTTKVLASLAVDLQARVEVEEPHVIGSWRIGVAGRKYWSGVALWDARGGVLAVGRALWIELRESK